MKQSILNVFSSSIEEVLISLCNCDLTIDHPHTVNVAETIDDINIVLQISGDIKGEIIYSMSDTFLLEIASHMMELSVTNIDSLTLSASSEIGNIITGKAVTKLSGLGFNCEFSVPKVLIGKNIPIKLSNNLPTLISAFTSFGTISLLIATN